MQYLRSVLCWCLLLSNFALFAQFPSNQLVRLTDIGNNWYPDYELAKDKEPYAALVSSGLLSEAQFITAVKESTPASRPEGFKNRSQNYPAFYSKVEQYKAYYIGEWTWTSPRDASYKMNFALVWIPTKENQFMPKEMQPLSKDGMFLIMNPGTLIGKTAVVKNEQTITNPSDKPVVQEGKNTAVITNSTNAKPITKTTISRDSKAPKGPAYDAVVQAYIQNDVDAVAQKLPAYEKLYPTHLHTVFFKAWIADQRDGDRDAAMRTYSDIIRKDSLFADAYVWRSKAFWNKGLDDRAIADINKAISIQGSNSPAYYYTFRADYYYSIQSYSAAMADFKQAIKLAPTNILNYTGFLNVALSAGNTSEVEPLLTSAINTQPQNAELVLELGTFLMRSNRFRESDAAFTKAFAMPGSNASGHAYNNASIAAYKLKDYNKATVLSEKAMALMPKKIEFIFNRASIAIDLQQWETIYQWAQKALTLDANSAYANMLMALGVKRTGRGDALSAEYEAKAKRLAAEGK